MQKKRKKIGKKDKAMLQTFGSKLVIIGIAAMIVALLLFFGYRQNTAFIGLTNAQETATTTATLTPPSVAETLGLTPEPTKREKFRIPILMYHYVEHIHDHKDTFREMMNIYPETFEEQLKTLKEAGYTFMTMREVGEILDGKAVLPPKPVVLTFDDGYTTFETEVVPLLQKYQAKGVVYVIPDFTGQPNHMTEAQLHSTMESGLVEIGAHTLHHVYLAGNTKEEVTKEITGSKMMLEYMLGISIVSFAYPFGAFDEQAVLITEEAGFTTAVTTLPGIEAEQANRFVLDRLRPGVRVGAELTDYLEGTHFEAY